MAKKNLQKGLDALLQDTTKSEPNNIAIKSSYIHSSFVIKKELHLKIRKYALDNDMKIQEVINKIVEEFFVKNEIGK